MGEPAIEVEHLMKRYGATSAVDDVFFQAATGESFGILGPNGAGKSTTVECLAGLAPADGGTVRVLGLDPQRDPAAIRGLLGVQLQESRLPARLQVIEALRLYAAFYPSPVDLEELVGRLGLSDRRDTGYGDLSGVSSSASRSPWL